MWHQTYGTDQDEVGNAIQYLNNGNFILVGYSIDSNTGYSLINLLYVDNVGNENWTGKFWQEIKVRTPEGEKYTVDIPCPLSSDGTSSLCTFEDELPKFGDKWPRDSRP